MVKSGKSKNEKKKVLPFAELNAHGKTNARGSFQSGPVADHTLDLACVLDRAVTLNAAEFHAQ